MGADMNQLIKAMTEAEAYKGPSLIIAYAPCINHGIKMTRRRPRSRRPSPPVTGTMYRYNPDLENPLTVDSKDPTESYQDFIKGENRYASLLRQFPDVAPALFEESEAEATSASRPTSAWPASKPHTSAPRAPQGRAGQSAARARRRERLRRRALSL